MRGVVLWPCGRPADTRCAHDFLFYGDILQYSTVPVIMIIFKSFCTALYCTHHLERNPYPVQLYVSLGSHSCSSSLMVQLPHPFAPPHLFECLRSDQPPHDTILDDAPSHVAPRQLNSPSQPTDNPSPKKRKVSYAMLHHLVHHRPRRNRRLVSALLQKLRQLAVPHFAQIFTP